MFSSIIYFVSGQRSFYIWERIKVTAARHVCAVSDVSVRRSQQICLRFFFVIFSKIYNLNVSELAVIVLCGFAAQIVSDAFAGMFCDKIGAKISGIIAHIFIFSGLLLLGGSSGIRLRKILFIRV